MTFSRFNHLNFKNKTILLFDIDGTLLRTGGIGQLSMQLAFKEVYNIEIDIKNGTFAGKTDHIIHQFLVKKYGVKPKLREFKKSYFKNLEEKLSKRKNLKPLPGILQFCQMASKRDDISLSLLTGNWRKGALLKIKHFGLKKFFNNGIFGDGITDRNILGEKAKKIFILSKKIVIIGDTPADIECAKVNNLFSIAVATGPYDTKELKKYKPHLLVEDFRNMNEILKFID